MSDVSQQQPKTSYLVYLFVEGELPVIIGLYPSLALAEQVARGYAAGVDCKAMPTRHRLKEYSSFAHSAIDLVGKEERNPLEGTMYIVDLIPGVNREEATRRANISAVQEWFRKDGIR